MLIVGFKNGKIKGIDFRQPFTSNKLIFPFDLEENEDEIKKIVNFRKGKILIGSEKKGIKLLNIYNKKKILF
jgi:hypothetical protein